MWQGTYFKYHPFFYVLAAIGEPGPDSHNIVIYRIIIFIMKDRNSISLSDQKLLILASKISPQAVISLKRSVSVSKSQLDSFKDSLQSIGKKKVAKTEYR